MLCGTLQRSPVASFDHDGGYESRSGGHRDGAESVAGPHLVAGADRLNRSRPVLGVDQRAGDETEMVRNLDGLVLALLGRLVVPPVAGNLADQVGAGVDYAQPVGREQ